MHKLDRPNEDEWPLIFDSWARSWRKSPWAGVIRNCDYDEVSRKAMSEIIDRATTRVTVAWIETESGIRRVMGYAITEPSRRIIHWVFVKRDFRGNGVARALRSDALGEESPKEWVYTHKTYACDRFLRGMKHAPEYARMK